MNGTDPFERRSSTDALLAVRCQLGEESAFDELVQRWHLPLWKYVRRLARDEDSARETLQEVWLRILRGIDRLREPSSLVPWIFRIARFAALDRLRQSYAEPGFVPADPELLEDESEPGELDEDLALLHEGLSELPLHEREILGLSYLQELDLREIAEILEVPVGTVKSRLFRARRSLREQLTHRGLNR